MRLFIVQIHTFPRMRLSRVFCVQCTITKVKREEHFEIAFGYSFEKACLFARSLGIGTVMLAASLSRSAKDTALGDIQKVDVGIALCHFDLVMAESGFSGKFLFKDPQINVPDNVYYITSYERIV